MADMTSLGTLIGTDIKNINTCLGTKLNCAGGALSGTLLMDKIGSCSQSIYFKSSDSTSADFAIRSYGEGLDFYEPEDGCKLHMRICDDSGVNAVYGLMENNVKLCNKYLGKTAKAADSDKLDGQYSSGFRRSIGNASANVGVNGESHWVTVAKNVGGRHSGTVIVSDQDSGDHSFIEINWVRSYLDSSFNVINIGGHANKITGVRVLYNNNNDGSNGNIYKEKLLQVQVTAQSTYSVKVISDSYTPGWGGHTVVTPIVEDTKTDYLTKGPVLTDIACNTSAIQKHLTVGGDTKVHGMMCSTKSCSSCDYGAYMCRSCINTIVTCADKVLMSGNICRDAHSSGYFVGGYNNIGASNTKTNPIFTIGGHYLPGDNDLCNMYGIGYSNHCANYDGISNVLGGSNWGLYVASAGCARIGLGSSNGVGCAVSCWKAPVICGTTAVCTACIATGRLEATADITAQGCIYSNSCIVTSGIIKGATVCGFNKVIGPVGCFTTQNTVGYYSNNDTTHCGKIEFRSALSVANADDTCLSSCLYLHTNNILHSNVSICTQRLYTNITCTDRIKFKPGTAGSDDASIEWLGSDNAGCLRISTSDDNGSEPIEFGDYDNTHQGGAFCSWGRWNRAGLQLSNDLVVKGGDICICNVNKGISFQDCNRMWLSTGGNKDWGLFWNTDTNSFELKAAGTTKQIFDIDANSITAGCFCGKASSANGADCADHARFACCVCVHQTDTGTGEYEMVWQNADKCLYSSTSFVIYRGGTSRETPFIKIGAWGSDDVDRTSAICFRSQCKCGDGDTVCHAGSVYLAKDGDLYTAQNFHSNALYSGALCANTIGVGQTDGVCGHGVSLYGGPSSGMPTYGMAFAKTCTYGTYGCVSGDWATYLTMSTNAGRGWIFKAAGGSNVASISNDGRMWLNSSMYSPTICGCNYQTRDQNSGYCLKHVSNSTTPVCRTSGNIITGGSDYAGLGKLNNVAVQTWYGFSISPTISGQAIAQGKPAFSVNARNGCTIVAGNATALGSITAECSITAGHYSNNNTIHGGVILFKGSKCVADADDICIVQRICLNPYAGSLETATTFCASQLHTDLVSACNLHAECTVEIGSISCNRDSKLSVFAGDANVATIQALGNSQGTGRLFVGQSTTYGGGIEYNGDNNPVTTGAGADYVTLYQKRNGTFNWTAKNYVNSYNWEFRGDVKAVSFTETSAKRYKTDICEYGKQTCVLCSLAKLRPVTYKLKEDSNHCNQYGFIAEDVEQVFPEFVQYDVSGEQVEGLQYAKMVSVLTAGIQELKELVEKQDKRIKELEQIL